jgi:hypothetical protein
VAATAAKGGGLTTTYFARVNVFVRLKARADRDSARTIPAANSQREEIMLFRNRTGDVVVFSLFVLTFRSHRARLSLRTPVGLSQHQPITYFIQQQMLIFDPLIISQPLLELSEHNTPFPECKSHDQNCG